MSEHELIQMIMLGQQNAGLEDEIQRQQAMADQLRTDAPEMRQAGRVTVAPNIMEYVGGMAKNFASGQLGQQAAAGKKQVIGNQQTQMIDFLKALTQKQSTPAPQPQMPQGTPGMPPTYGPFA